MSTGPGTHAAFIPGNQSTAEQDDSKSALFYLFQEVSKLSPPDHNHFLDTHSLSTWLNETSRQDPFTPFTVKNKKDLANLFQTSKGSCLHSLPCKSPYSQVKKVKEKSPSGKVATLVEPYPESNSPLRVLGLINRQCERLMHRNDSEESDARSVSSTIRLGHSTAKSTSAGAGVSDQGVGCDCVRAFTTECTLTPPPLIYEGPKVTASVIHVEDERGDCIGRDNPYKQQCCGNDSKVCCHVEPQMTENSKPLEDNASAAAQSFQSNKREVKSSVNGQFDGIHEISTGQDIFNLTFSESAVSLMHLPEDLIVALSKPAPTLDHNANLALTTEPPCDTQLPPSSSLLTTSQLASVSFGTAESCHSFSKQDDKITSSKPKSTDAPIQGKSIPAAHLTFCCCLGTNSSPSTPLKESRPLENEESLPLSTHHCSPESTWRTKTPRKQPNPTRSVDIQDPHFQGVTFKMDTELDESREQCRLLITSQYSKELCKSVRKPRLRTRASQKSLKSSSSEEESDPTNTGSKGATTSTLVTPEHRFKQVVHMMGIEGKVCASCCTRKTPMWRDAEDGTPLCNACGIRYKKYRVRCLNCWHIPRKEGNSNSCCLKCGNFVRLTSAQRKHST